MCLEAFQSGLSWLTILRKRQAFRAAFAGSTGGRRPYGDADVERLMADAGIVRNRAKIEAAIANARAATCSFDGLDALIWSFAPPAAARPAYGAPTSRRSPPSRPRWPRRSSGRVSVLSGLPRRTR